MNVKTGQVANHLTVLLVSLLACTKLVTSLVFCRCMQNTRDVNNFLQTVHAKRLKYQKETSASRIHLWSQKNVLHAASFVIIKDGAY